MLEKWEQDVSGRERKRNIPAIPYIRYSSIPKPDRMKLPNAFDPHSRGRNEDATTLPDPLASLD